MNRARTRDLKHPFAALLGVLAILALGGCASTPQTSADPSAVPDMAQASEPAGGPITVTGFERPESMLHDLRRNVYLVSNINGGPRDFDNNGFISRVSPSGQMLKTKWIEGGVNGVTLNGPKGMALVNDTLYVADIDHLRKFDARTGRPLGSIFFPNATFLNDVTNDLWGNVFVSDIGFTTVPSFGPSGTDAVYKVTPKNQVSVIAQGNALLHHPNGLAALPNGKVVVVTYDPFESTKELFTLDMQGRKSNVITMPTGLLDGVVLTPYGLIVSSWVDFANSNTGVIYQVKFDGTIRQIYSGFQNPSDIGFDLLRSRILVPELPDPGTGGKVDLLPMPR